MTIPSINIGGAATNVLAKPLIREGIRCKKLSRGLAAISVLRRFQLQDFLLPLPEQGLQFGRPRLPDETHADFADGFVTNVQHQKFVVKAQHLQLALLN